MVTATKSGIFLLVAYGIVTTSSFSTNSHPKIGFTSSSHHHLYFPHQSQRKFHSKYLFSNDHCPKWHPTTPSGKTPTKNPFQLSATSSSSSSSPSSWTKPTPLQDSLAGLTVAISLLSKAIACSAIIGVNPLVGLWSSVVMGITAPLLGSRSGVISGTAAVVTVPLAALTNSLGGAGVEYMALCIVLAAAMEGLFGVLRLAKLAQLVSEQVLSGFLNGLGFILLLSQGKVFQSAAKAGSLGPAVAMAGLCFGIVQVLPLVTKAVPSSLVGLMVASVVGSVMKLPLATLESTVAPGTFAGGMSSLPSLINLNGLWSQITSIKAVKLVLPAAVSIVIISLVETLLASKVVDELTGQKLCPYEYQPGNPILPEDETEVEECILTDYDVPTRSVLAMSFGNALSAILGGFGGCGLIPQTVLNIKSGGGGMFSSASYALAMAGFVVFLAPLVGKISEAALAGIMVTVAYDTVAWESSFKTIKAVLKPEGGGNKAQRLINLFTLGLTSYICYFGNLAVGIIGGVAAQRGLLSLSKKFGWGNASPASA